jgi:hypothetical protein
MMQFSIKDLLLGTAFVAIGVALLSPFFRGLFTGAGFAEYLFCWFGGGAFIGAGFGTPFGRPWIGAGLGAEVQLLLLLCLFIKNVWQ